MPITPGQGSVSIDIIDGARWREEGGEVVEISRVAIVSNILANIGGAQNPFVVVADQVIQYALDHAQVPKPPAQHPVEPQLILRDRAARAMDTQTVRIELIYRLPKKGTFPPPGDTWLVSGGSHVEQATFVTDKNGDQVTVEHNGVVQGVEIHPFVSRGSLQMERIEKVSAPWLLTSIWTNTVNTGSFAFDPGAQPGTWLMTNVHFELTDRKTIPPTYRTSYECQKNPEGHDPVAVFIDPETGRPPPDLVAGEGVKSIAEYDAQNFAALFG